MITPLIATIILVGFLLIFGILLPVLNVKFPQYISYRWLCIVVILAVLIGVVIDFESLGDTARHIALVGSLVITGIYVVMRTWEKAQAKGWHIGHVEVSKGDMKASYDDTKNIDTTNSK